MGALSAYLVLYNASCMLGWASALVLAVQSLLATGGDLTQVWAATGLTLQVSQWAMCLEIVHAATGMVRSPVVTVFLQVMSRLVLVVVCLLSPASSATWWCGMMAVSWSLVEVPRYAFYLNGLLGPGGQAGTLYPVFWLRYSLFGILYPTGISGELGTMISALSDPVFLKQPWLVVALLKTVLASYVPGSPFLYMNMVWNRKAAFKKRFAPPPPPPQAPVGAEFPLDSKGGRSTSEVGKKVFAAALAGAGTPEGDKASAACAKERNWRFGYDKHIVKARRLPPPHANPPSARYPPPRHATPSPRHAAPPSARVTPSARCTPPPHAAPLASASVARLGWAAHYSLTHPYNPLAPASPSSPHPSLPSSPPPPPTPRLPPRWRASAARAPRRRVARRRRGCAGCTNTCSSTARTRSCRAPSAPPSTRSGTHSNPTPTPTPTPNAEPNP